MCAVHRSDRGSVLGAPDAVKTMYTLGCGQRRTSRSDVCLCARICALSYICKVYLSEIPAHTCPCACPCDWVQACACACAYLCTDGLVRDCGVSSALAMETLRSCAEPSMYACTFVPSLSNNIRPPSRTLAWTVICIKPPRPSTVRSRYCTDRFDTKLQADSILTHRSRFGKPWVSVPSTPGNLSML